MGVCQYCGATDGAFATTKSLERHLPEGKICLQNQITTLRSQLEEADGLVKEMLELAMAVKECRTNECSECYNRALKILKHAKVKAMLETIKHQPEAEESSGKAASDLRTRGGVVDVGADFELVP